MAKNPGAIAYQGYYNFFNGKVPPDEAPDDSEWDMESWSDLDSQQKKAWLAVAVAVLQEITPNHYELFKAARAHLQSTNQHPHSDEWVALSEAVAKLMLDE